MMRYETTTFFCNGCQTWTSVAEYSTETEIRCSRCGDNYGCDECGYEIDWLGTCLRNHPDFGDGSTTLHGRLEHDSCEA